MTRIPLGVDLDKQTRASPAGAGNGSHHSWVSACAALWLNLADWGRAQRAAASKGGVQPPGALRSNLSMFLGDLMTAYEERQRR